MPNKPSFQTIQLADLAAIIGGCGKKQQPPPQQPAPQPLPPAGGPEISTNVQISGYGGAQ